MSFDDGGCKKIYFRKLLEDSTLTPQKNCKASLEYRLEGGSMLLIILLDIEDMEQEYFIDEKSSMTYEEGYRIQWKDNCGTNKECTLEIEFIDQADCLEFREAMQGSTLNNHQTELQYHFELLPDCTLNNLEDIAKAFLKVVSNDYSLIRRNAIVDELFSEENRYIYELLDIFDRCDDIGDIESCTLLFTIFKCLLNFGCAELYQVLFNDECFIPLVGILSYQPTPNGKFFDFRQCIQGKMKLKQIVPFEDELIVEYIHQNYRIETIKDYVFPKLMDDTLLKLGSMVQSHNAYIVHFLAPNQQYIKSIVQVLQDERRWHEGLSFLLEFCRIMKALNGPAQALNQDAIAFFNNLCQDGVLAKVLSKIIVQADLETRTKALHLTFHIIMHDPDFIRVHVTKYESQIREPSTSELDDILTCENRGLMAGLIGFLSGYYSPGNVGYALDILMYLGTVDTTKEDLYLKLFYSQYLPWIHNLLQFSQVKKKESFVSLKAICHFLSFCVKKHGHRCKYFFIRNEPLPKILELLHCEDMDLILASLRLVRCIVGTKEAFLIRHIISTEAFRHILQLYVDYKDNLINSAILELLSFIATENSVLLIMHICKDFSSVLEKLKSFPTIVQLQQKYNQILEDEAVKIEKFKTQEESDEEKEQAYFEGSDGAATEPDETVEASSKEQASPPFLPRLVDYDDDENTSLIRPLKKECRMKFKIALKTNSINEIQENSSKRKMEEEPPQPSGAAETSKKLKLHTSDVKLATAFTRG